MKILNKDTDYAVMTLMFLAQAKDFTSANVIAETQKIPYRFLRRILARLMESSIIESRKGVKGGVRLLKHPDGINILDLMELFQGEFKLSDCMFRNKVCSNIKTCILRREIKRVEASVKKEFLGITISSLLKKIKTGG